MQVDVRQKRRDHRALGRAPLDRQQTPLFEHARLQPLADQAQHAPVPDPVLQEPHQPGMAHAVEERPDVGIQDPVDLPPVDPDHERVQRMVLAAPRPEAIGEAEEVRLVDGVQHFHHRALDDLVLQRGDAERPLPAVGLGDVLPPGRLRPVGAPLYASMQIREVGLEVCLVLVPGEAVDAWCRPAFQLMKRKAQQVDVHMVQERRQPDPFTPPCGATYAVQCLGYACPALRLVRAALNRIALGPAPSLHRLRGRQRGLVRRLPRYYGRVRLPPAVHHRIGAIGLADADRPGGRARTASRWISRFPCRWLPRVQEVL